MTFPVIVLALDDGAHEIHRVAQAISPGRVLRVLGPESEADAISESCRSVLAEAGSHRLQIIGVATGDHAVAERLGFWRDVIAQRLRGVEPVYWAVFAVDDHTMILPRVRECVGASFSTYVVTPHLRERAPLAAADLRTQAAAIIHAHRVTGTADWLLAHDVSGAAYAAGFGASVFLPELMRTQLAAKRAVTLVRSGFMTEGSANYVALGRSSIPTMRLTHEEVGRELRGKIGSGIAVEPLSFKMRDLQFWPDRLRSQYDYLRTDRFSRLQQGLRETRAAMEGQRTEHLREDLDRLITNEPPVENAERYLNGVEEGLADEAERAEQWSREAERSRPDLSVRHDALVRSIQRLPYLQAVLARWSLLGFIIWQFMLMFVHAFRGRGIVAEWLTPGDRVVAIVAWSVTALGAFGRLLWARMKLQRARKAYARAIAEDLKVLVEIEVRRESVALLQDLRRLVGSKDAPDTGETGEVRRLRKRCGSVVTELETELALAAPTAPLTASPICDLIWDPASLSDAEFVHLDEHEAARLAREVGSTLLADWRESDAHVIRRRAMAWAELPFKDLTDMSALFGISELAAERASEVLGHTSSPVVADDSIGHSEAPFRIFVVPDTPESEVARAITRRMIPPSSTIESADTCFAGLLVLERFDPGAERRAKGSSRRKAVES